METHKENRTMLGDTRARTIAFCRPSRTVPVSTTGAVCKLGCAHCNGHYLKAMRPANEMLEQLRASGPSGSSGESKASAPASILVSGGCTADGKVPMGDWPALLKGAAASGTRFNCHAGLVDDAEAEAVASWADVVSFDIVADPFVIQEVYGLDRTEADYARSYRALARRVTTVPHICIGLGQEVGGPELAAMRMVQEAAEEEGLVPPALVFIVFIPTAGTRFARRPAPTPQQVAAVLREARVLFPHTPIHLGCMRPGGAWRRQADVLAIDVGVDLIVQPAPEAEAHARELGMRIVEMDECCVFSGVAPRRIRVSAGTAAALGLADIVCDDAPTTAYVMVGGRCARDCAFCAQARSSHARADKLSRVTWPEFDGPPLAAALHSAARDGRMHRACAQVVGTPDALDQAVRTIRFLKQAGGAELPVSVSFSASSSVEHVGALIEAGADRVALPLDAASPSLHEKVKGHSMERALALIRECAARYPGRISTHLIAGLGESEEELLRLAAEMMGIGVTCGLFAFTPIPGTRMADVSPPPLDSYRRVQVGMWQLRQGVAIDKFAFHHGRLVRLDADLEGYSLRQLAQAFQTSGCPGCNRPYYNERPGHVPYNYPRPLNADEAAEALRATGLVEPEEVGPFE